MKEFLQRLNLAVSKNYMPDKSAISCADKILNHELSVLGSTPAVIRYGMECKGFEGHKYYEPEPLPEDSKLRKPRNIILTPHIAGFATNGKLRIGSHVCDEIENYNSNTPLYCEVKQEMLSKMA